MAHAHDHGSASTDRRRLVIAIAIIGAFLVVQVVGGVLSGSLALLADAGHMTSDLLGLVIALGAAVVAARPANDRQTYGFRRFEVFGALANGVILIVVAVTVSAGAIDRLVSGTEGEAHEVAGGLMLAVALAGLAANVAAMLVLRSGAKGSMNVRGVYLEVLGDTIGSVLVIGAALVIVATGWNAADAIASLAIAVLIVPRALLLLRDVMRVLSQSTPAETDVAEIRDHILRTRGVVAVHDVHVWAITTGAHVFSAHVEVEPAVFADDRVGALLDELGGCLSEHFDVDHSTFQLEPSGRGQHEHATHA
ncbi:cobalt-zinc-cadmium efflux system protein [Agromyces flavus]|uniref:Cobalt-zinc-cadmium efflux system protein n=1 Tax=Agromyces flavus TaxID=589382 RepID=A0A1H1NUJ5_9MICO|nr:cation diffusion facilitator family transporter [Agromyces flavus]MCP2368043.1 cobalt-zinc-cadmium efflux system protein [Agromyces flavus]SDS02460.1 cobalt-zinc-cadmium efflux system protein [Agromyces flavus]